MLLTNLTVLKYRKRGPDDPGMRLKVVLKVLSFVQSGEPPGTRTQDPRLKRADETEEDQGDTNSQSSK